MLNEAELGRFVDDRMGHSVFRLETRDRYAVESDAGNVARYLAGEPAPSMAVKGPWLRRLEQERAAGKRRTRAHVLHSPLSDYLRYECEWGYAYTAAAGEEIFILDLAEVPRPDGLVDADFLLLDDAEVVLVHYNEDDQFIGAEPRPSAEVSTYRRCRDAAIAAAVSFGDYWASHSQYWRENWLQAPR
jgi:hypothetical protein